LIESGVVAGEEALRTEIGGLRGRQATESTGQSVMAMLSAWLASGHA
jgi:hypothetical protein